MSQENLKYWLALSKIPGLGPARIKNLYEHFGSTRKIWEASTSELFQIEGIGKVIALRIAAERKRINPDKEIESLPKNVDILTLDDPVYPSNLKNIYDPPSVLYIKGKLVSEDKNAIAIV